MKSDSCARQVVRLSPVQRFVIYIQPFLLPLSIEYYDENYDIRSHLVSEI